ncbi:MAG: RES domain-containing protein [Nitriliruptor sp.]|nr:MAG: RES domain-containing protein [Nitriliruptor sp.]
MSADGCGDPDGCRVPDPDDVDLRRLPSVILSARTPLRRGHKSRYRAQEAVPARPDLPPVTQMSRFAPVRGQAHVYVARREIAALLESAFHSLVPDSPRIHWPQLVHWSLSHVTLRRDVRLIDLRDPVLTTLGLDRNQLVATDPAHYPCTRRWAERLAGRHIGGKPTVGLLWHSRQAEIHAEQGVRPLLADVLVGEQAEVAVLWPTTRQHLLTAEGTPTPLSTGRGLALVQDLANLLGAPPPLNGPANH